MSTRWHDHDPLGPAKGVLRGALLGGLVWAAAYLVWTWFS